MSGSEHLPSRESINEISTEWLGRLCVDPLRSPDILGRPELVTRRTFNIVAERHDAVDAHASRIWNQAINMRREHIFADSGVRLSKQPTPTKIDISVVYATLKEVEAGTRHLYGLGSGGWNILAELAQIRLAGPLDRMPLILPWDESIHPQFRNGKEAVSRAAQQLQERYEAMQAEVALQPTLF